MRQLVSGAYTTRWWCLHKCHGPVITIAHHLLGFIVDVKQNKRKQTKIIYFRLNMLNLYKQIHQTQL